MDFESPDVEKDFPGLYASESGRKSNESDFSDGGEHEKHSKKDLLGRRKEKKEKKEKERGYAALEGESSPEEDTDTKSPSKSKKTKSFKFPTKSKEKREKSRDKEKVLEEAVKQKELTEKEKKKEREREKEREKEKKEKEKREKLKEKDKAKEKEEKAKFKLESKEKLKDDKKDKTKEKDKDKVKEKDKDKIKEKDKDKVKEKDKDKKQKLTKVPSTVTSGIPFEEIFTLGVALPIFGVPLQQSVERSRCHDDTGLPLLVRDSIDYLQAYGLKSGQIYRMEADKIKLQQLRKLYTDRGATFPYHWDVPVACAIIKSFLSELPEPVLTQELHTQFEQTTAIAEPQRMAAMLSLINKLPHCNHSLLGWLTRHFESVLANEQSNHVTLQTICNTMCPALNMSQTLLAYLITKADKLFPDVRLTKYVPPLLSLPSDFPETANEIAEELRKQESLLSQIHAEMHAGFITPPRDQQLWEAQRIVTQLKRKLRSVQKSVEPNSLSSQQHSVDEKPPEDQPSRKNSQVTEPSRKNSQVTEPSRKNSQVTEPSRKNSQVTEPSISIQPIDAPDGSCKLPTVPQNDVFQPEIKQESPKIQEFAAQAFAAEFEDNFDFGTKDLKKETPSDVTEIPPIPPPPPVEKKEKPKLTENEMKKLRLELENAEYLQLKSLLQAKINSEQFEIVKLRSQVALKNKQEGNIPSMKETKENYTPEEQELKQRLIKENAVLEQKRLSLINQIFQERVACTQLKIELAMKELL